jgi:uncharacterized protein (TIGR03118 family)
MPRFRDISRRRAAAVLAGAAVVAAALGAFALRAGAAESKDYTVRNLVSDGSVPAERTDANLVNAWGLTAGPTTPWWVADNGTDKSTLYNGDGVPLPLVVGVAGAPTGAVSNIGGTNFVVHSGAASGAARFLFDTESGTILGWNPAVSPDAVLAVDRSSAGAVYKGLAISRTTAGDFLYAADFANGRVDVFDGSFGLVTTPGAFTDPNLPAGYGPFGIQNIGDHIFVSYAKQGEEAEEEPGQGLGFVDEYDVAGTLIRRVASRGQLNAPWGLAQAPQNFGRFGGDLLVGNFGDGQINAYALSASGQYEHAGTLREVEGKKIEVDGLWALGFGNGAASGPRDSLYFTAGPNDEEGGLFGVIRAAS